MQHTLQGLVAGHGEANPSMIHQKKISFFTEALQAMLKVLLVRWNRLDFSVIQVQYVRAGNFEPCTAWRYLSV